MKRNQMQPVPYNPLWDDGRHADEPRVLWISDNCAIVNLLPVCRIKLGKRKVRGDLFKGMRKYLDERETDPLPCCGRGFCFWRYSVTAIRREV